ncbi:MAG: cupredoxin domain-containing protein [Hyphomicrobium sp.]|uniref:cupredoxin domain-containing protein n=1 Tax=Hyphomicrobium sp. TaxID=82 RepID=UPI00356B5EB0
MSFRSIGHSIAYFLPAFAVVCAVVVGSIGQGFAVAPANAAEELEIEIKIKDHKFDPAAVKLPAGQRAKIIVKNLDPTPEEFESNDIGFEKIIAGNSEATIRIKPLEAGTYIFFGEFHMDSALGHILVE